MDHAVWFGVAGGLLGNAVRLIKIANMPPQERQPIFNDPWYYLQLVLLAAFGGFFAYLHQISGTKLNPILAVNIGAAAPILAQQFGSTANPVGPTD